MKISLYIPKGTVGMAEFIRKEQATAKNIKSLQTRQEVMSGLNRISYSL
jgi:peptide subunit release factor 1 (eRF1)